MEQACRTDEVVFPLLANPATYRAGEWDLAREPGQLDYWLDLFRRHFPLLLAEALRELEDRGLSRRQARESCAHAEREFYAYLEALAENPEAFGRLDILAINERRQQILDSAGLGDVYRLAKSAANQTALDMLAGVLREIDGLEELVRPGRIVRGILAGNIYDLGATKTAELFHGRPVDFHGALAKLKPRPWVVDDLPFWCERLGSGRPYRKAILLVDNAGPDVVLGMIPLARDLAGRGTEVVLAANSGPALNDITYDELVPLLEQCALLDEALAAVLAQGRLRPVPSGNRCALIDLARISPELAAEAEGADLVVLEGMGRAIESNWSARFTCDVVKVAMVKTGGLAERFGWQVFDLVFRYESAGMPNS